jgi:hypothetical protein
VPLEPAQALSSICLNTMEMKMLSKSWQAFRSGSRAKSVCVRGGSAGKPGRAEAGGVENGEFTESSGIPPTS